MIAVSLASACTDSDWVHSSASVVEVLHDQACFTDGVSKECVPIESVKVPPTMELKPGSCVDVRRFGGSARYDSATVVTCEGG